MIASGGRALADPADDLVAHGEQLARQGEWSLAIQEFKAADAAHPRTAHACLIGLTYLRRDLLAQAELFLARCRERATADDPVPEWFEPAAQQLAGKLATANLAALSFEIVPATATIALTSFAPDETFTARTIHVAPGTYVATISAPGYAPERRDIVVGATAQIVHVALRPLHPLRPAVPASRVPYYLLAGAGAIALAGGAYDVFAVGPARDRLAGTNAQYDANLSTFQQRRDLALGLYAGAALVAAGALVLHFTWLAGEPAYFAAAPAPRGAIATLGWSR